MIGIIGNQHIASAVEADAVADTAVGQLDKDAGFALRGDLADGALVVEVRGVEIALEVTGRALDPRGETAGFCEDAVGV